MEGNPALVPAALGPESQQQRLPSGVLGQPDPTGTAEAVQICQMLQQIEATVQQHVPAAAQGYHQPLLPQPVSVSVFEAAARQPQQQQQQQGGLSIQQQTVHVVPAAAPRHTVVTAARPPAGQQYLSFPQQAQQYGGHLPAVPSVSAVGAAGTAQGHLEAGLGLPGHLLPHTGALTPAPGVSAKDAAAAARAARQRKRKELAAAAAEKAAAAAAAAAREAYAMHAARSAAAGRPAGLPPVPPQSVAMGPPNAAAAAGVAGLEPEDYARLAGEGGSYGDVAGLEEGGSDERTQRRMIKNRESAARSRARRQEYTAALEQQVAQLREQNRGLRVQVVLAAAAPSDPHAGRLDGHVLRRTRTTPL